MRFYTQQHKHYCGIDLHARKMYVCIISQRGKVKVHKNIKTDPELFFELIFAFLDDIVVSVECVFCWYWLADFCALHRIPFILGHALYMKAIHGGKTKNDKIDSYKIASLLKGGNFPVAYPYMDFSRALAALMASSGSATSINFLRFIINPYCIQHGSKAIISFLYQYVIPCR